MRAKLVQLWDDCFAEKCSRIRGAEEKRLTKALSAKRRAFAAIASKEQNEAMDEYAGIWGELNGILMRNAFFMGCEYASSLFTHKANFYRRAARRRCSIAQKKTAGGYPRRSKRAHDRTAACPFLRLQRRATETAFIRSRQ